MLWFMTVLTLENVIPVVISLILHEALLIWDIILTSCIVVRKCNARNYKRCFDNEGQKWEFEIKPCAKKAFSTSIWIIDSESQNLLTSIGVPTCLL